VVDRGQPELGGERDTRTGSELVGVEPAAQTGGGTGREHRPCLVGVEGTGLAERVDPPRVRRRRGEHRAGDQVDVSGGVVGVLRRYDVRPEEGRLVGEPRRHLQ
jgi:hypothetical protein